MAWPGLSDLPAALREPVEAALDDCPQLDAAALPEDIAQSLPAAWACSPFLRGWCTKNADAFAALAGQGYFAQAAKELAGDTPDLDDVDDLAGLMRALRCWRNRRLARIAWRDLAGWADLDEVLGELSAVADTAVQAALSWLQRDADGPPLIVIGMGKLGGQELNFSSDIDIILACRDREDGDTKAATRLAQKLVQVLGEKTADGFVYRVDTRLRPFGDSGPLVASIGAIEQYYQTHGREWERYAWIKARPIAGDLEGGRELLARLRPFVYRRYLDFNAFEAIRDMKGLIEKQVQRGGLEDNIKIGRGGIREIEFIGQAFQLIRGGHEPALQERRLLPVLDKLAAARHLPDHVVETLAAAYRFLRRLENRLQLWADRQTHVLPEDAAQREALALAMGAADWPALNAQVNDWRSQVHEQFRQVFVAPQIEGEQDEASQALRAAWLDEDADGAKLLQAQGYADPEQSWAAVTALRDSAQCRALGERGRRRLAELIPMLIQSVATREAPDTTLRRMLSLLEAFIGRSTYVALLVENPASLSRLIVLCAASPWITHQIASQPLLLDTLMDPRLLHAPPRGPALRAELERAMGGVGAADLERRMDRLRQFRHEQILRIAAADISDSLPLMVVSDHLTELAVLLVQTALDEARAQLAPRYGEPSRKDGSRASFAIVGYGKLGGIELGYGSDLDLVFIHDGDADGSTDGERQLDHQTYFLRLAQRLIHILSTRTGAGRVYEIDTRLRPSGQSGLLVTSLAAFGAYQRDKAWTWEHQALVRARPIAGDEALRAAFRRTREEVLARPRDERELAQSVVDMRAKMRSHLDHSRAGRLDVKQMPGGLVDIEFMAQYRALRDGGDCPEVLIFTDTIRILETLESAGRLPLDATRSLTGAFRKYRRLLHRSALQEQRATIADSDMQQQREAVAALWSDMLGANS